MNSEALKEPSHASLLIDTWDTISQYRTETYAWFAAIFANELDDTRLIQYQKGALEALLIQFDSMGLPCTRFRQALSDFSKIPDLKLELAADFSQLFLLEGKHSALPYASFYHEPTQQLMGVVESKMQAFLGESGFKVHPLFREPADHLSIYLTLLEHWIIQEKNSSDVMESAQSQGEFIHIGLLSWLPPFAKRCQTIKTVSDFYPALAELLLHFVLEDYAYLTDHNPIDHLTPAA